MKSKISILDCYITAKYEGKYYIVLIDTDERTLDIKKSKNNQNIFDIGVMDTKQKIEISIDFNEFIERLEKKYLK